MKKNIKEKIELVIAITFEVVWTIIVIPLLIAPINMSVFEKAIVSTAGAMGGFALFVSWQLNKMW